MESGSLAQKAVLSLLTELNRNRATGSLKLERAPLQKAVYFRDGQILFAASNDPKDQLASILVEEGKLGPDQMQIAQARVSAGNPLAKVLTELGYISQRELADAARLKVEKILTDLFSWKEGTYQFAEKSLPKGAIDLELSTPRLLFNSIRRMQDREWVLLELGSLDTVLSPDSSLNDFIAETEADDQAQDVLRNVDGVKNVKQLGTSSALGEFDAVKVLAAAHLLGAIQSGRGGTGAEPSVPEQPAQEDVLSLSTDDILPEGAAVPGASAPPESTVHDAGRPPLQDLDRVPAPPPPQPVGPPPPLVPEMPRKAPSLPPSLTGVTSGFPIDEPESEFESEPMEDAFPSRPRPRGLPARGGASKKILIAAAGLVLLIGGGAAGYYFLWPMISPPPSSSKKAPTKTDAATGKAKQPPGKSPGQTASVTPGSKGPPDQPRQATEQPVKPPTPVGETPVVGKQPTDPSQPANETPGKQTPPSATGKAPPTGQARPPGRPTPPSQPPVTPRTSTTPPRRAAGPGASLSTSQDLLRSGKVSDAATAYLRHLRSAASDKFTIAVGVYCDVNNVNRAYKNSGNSDQLIILPYTVRGRPCYRVFWGLFDSPEMAQRNVGSIPSAIRSPDSISVPVAKLIR